MAFSVSLGFVVFLGDLDTAHAESNFIQTKRVHLGKAGLFEWEIFKNQPIDAERLEVRFEAKANTMKHTLRIWQRDVKQTWPVLTQRSQTGLLKLAETALECVLALPVGALRDGENILLTEAPPPANARQRHLGRSQSR